MAVLGLRFCARAFSSCGKRGPLFIAVCGPLTIAASLAVEHRLQTRRLSNCGSRAQLLCGMWNLPRPGLEPVFPALAGRFSTTAPPGKAPPFFDNTNQLTCDSPLQIPWPCFRAQGLYCESPPENCHKLHIASSPIHDDSNRIEIPNHMSQTTGLLAR